MQIVVFNGPPRAGKDSASRRLVTKLEDAGCLIPIREVSLSTPLRKIAYAMTGWTGDLDGPAYELFKTHEFAEFGGRTGRQLLIDVSESFLKTLYGKEIMARMLLSDLEGFTGIAIIRDGGFQLEIDEFLRHMSHFDLFVVRVSRFGCDFSNDSRESVSHPIADFNYQLRNHGSLDDLDEEVVRLVRYLTYTIGWKF